MQRVFAQNIKVNEKIAAPRRVAVSYRLANSDISRFGFNSRLIDQNRRRVPEVSPLNLNVDLKQNARLFLEDSLPDACLTYRIRAATRTCGLTHAPCLCRGELSCLCSACSLPFIQGWNESVCEHNHNPVSEGVCDLPSSRPPCM